MAFILKQVKISLKNLKFTVIPVMVDTFIKEHLQPQGIIIRFGITFSMITTPSDRGAVASSLAQEMVRKPITI